MPEIQEEEIDLREYINVLLKRKGVIILMISKPKYQVELEPKIQTQFIPDISLATYESLIKDREIEEEVIKKLNLDQPPYELNPDSLHGMIAIESLKNTNLIKLNLQAGNPKLAKDIANVWAELFIEKNKNLNLRESKEAQGFIEEQLKISNQNLSKIEEEIREFNETNNIDAMEKEISEKLNKIMGNESRLADVKISAESDKAKIEEIKNQMASQEKLISSSNIERLTEGMKFIEAKGFIESQLNLYRKKLQAKEDELKTFNQESKISLREKEIASKINQIVNFNNRLINLKVLIEQEKTRIKIAEEQLNEQEKTFILTKSFYDDASLNQLISEISEEEALLLKNLKLESEELNSLHIKLEGRIINSEINLETYQTEMAKIVENIDILEYELDKDKKEFAIEKLKLVNLEREKKVIESTYIMLANKMKEIEIATATPENQQKIARYTNPEYLSLQKQLIESTIMQKTLQAEEKQLKENVNEAWERVEVLKQELAQEKLTQLRLEREYDTTKGVYSVLSQKNEEVKIAVATESGLVKIASLAYEPEYPIKPNKKLNILIAGVLGLFVGIFIAFFLEFWQKGK
jgi:capsular polysaccharide biosynthesis protein